MRRCLCLPVLLLLACGGTRAPASKPIPDTAMADLLVTRGSQVILRLVVEIAETPADRAQGLMARPTLGRDKGMAFLFDSETTGPFTMKNTLIPLDIAFWDRSLLVVDVKMMTPCEQDPCPLYQSSGTFFGAVEANAGALTTPGVTAGDRVTLRRRS